MRRGALARRGGRRQLAVGEDRHDLVGQLDLGDFDRLHHAGREDLLDAEILDVGDVEGARWVAARWATASVSHHRQLQGEAECPSCTARRWR
jgi:hypothetical protein